MIDSLLISIKSAIYFSTSI